MPRQGEYQGANGSGFEESQHILRVKGREFRVVLVVWPKDKKPDNVNVTSDAGSISVSAGGSSVRVDRSGSIR